MSDSRNGWRPGDLLVFVPLGVVATLKDAVASVVSGAGGDGPGDVIGALAARGRSELATRREQLDTIVGLARSVGGSKGTSSPTESGVARTVGAPMTDASGATTTDASGATAAAATDVSVPDAAVSEKPDDADLPIADYDTLSATQIAQRLTGLDRDELLAVKAYEDATRRRRTIIGRIDSLVAAADD